MTDLHVSAPAATDDAALMVGHDGTRDLGGKLKRLGSESLVYGLGSMAERSLSYLLVPYYAHHFDPAQNGVQSVVYSYIPIMSVALYLGMDVAYMRNAAVARDAPMHERQRAFTMSFATVAIIGGIIAAIALAATPWLASIARLDPRAFRYMLAVVYSDALLAIPFAHLRMTNRAKRYALLRILFVGVSVGLNVLLIGRLHWGIEAIFLANVIANLLVLALFVAEIVRFFRPALLRGAPWLALWHFALPFMAAMLAVMLVENGDRIVLNRLPEQVARAAYGMTTKDVVGVYSFNYKLGVAMLVIVQMFRMAWLPFALQHAREHGAPQLFSRVLTVLMLACSAMFLTVAVLLPSLVEVPAIRHFVKSAYWAGLPIVPVILLGYVFSGVYAMATTGLYIERKTGVLPWIAGAGAALNISICAIAASRWGMIGVAWATPAAYALMAALAVWQSNRVYPVPFEWRRMAQLALIVALLLVADRWSTAIGVSPLAVTGLAVKSAVLLGFPLLLVVTGFFRAGEWSAMRSLYR